MCFSVIRCFACRAKFSSWIFTFNQHAKSQRLAMWSLLFALAMYICRGTKPIMTYIILSQYPRYKKKKLYKTLFVGLLMFEKISLGFLKHKKIQPALNSLMFMILLSNPLPYLASCQVVWRQHIQCIFRPAAQCRDNKIFPSVFAMTLTLQILRSLPFSSSIDHFMLNATGDSLCETWRFQQLAQSTSQSQWPYIRKPLLILQVSNTMATHAGQVKSHANTIMHIAQSLSKRTQQSSQLTCD